VTGRVQQPTTRPGQRLPSLSQVFAPSWGRPIQAPRPAAPAVAAPAASTVAAPQYSISNLPPDASYDDVIASLTKNRDTTIAGLVGERTRTLSDYGFQEGPNGAITFDVNNPFSKASVMKKTYDTNRRATGQTMGAGGQLYSGSFQNAQDLINRNQLQSEDTLTKGVQAFLARNTGQQAEAGTGFETAAAQAYGDRVGRFQSNPLYDPATADSTPDAAPAAGAPAAGARAAGQTKAARGFLWQQNSNGTWRKIRPLNAFGR